MLLITVSISLFLCLALVCGEQALQPDDVGAKGIFDVVGNTAAALEMSELQLLANFDTASVAQPTFEPTEAPTEAPTEQDNNLWAPRIAFSSAQVSIIARTETENS